MTGRQVVGIWMLVALAVILLRVVPSGSLYSRLLLRRWDVRRRDRFGQPGRRDFVRYALYCLGGGAALAAATFFGLGALLEHVPPLSGLETWLSGFAFGGLVIGGMCVLGGVVLLFKAAFWKPLPPLAFRLYRGEEAVAETRLEREALGRGIVSGGVRPLPSFAALAPAVRDLSDAIARSTDVVNTVQLVQAFSHEQAMRVVDADGHAVGAHSVIVVDLGRLKAGRGFWTEVNLRDVNAWRGRRSTSDGAAFE